MKPSASATNSTGQKNVPFYRWKWRKRSAAGTANNNYTNFFKLVDAMNTNGANYISTVANAIDAEQWGQLLGLEHAIGNGDSYGYRNGQNLYAYRPDKAPSQWQLLLYDLEYGFTVSPTAEVFEYISNPLQDISDPVLVNLWQTNAFRRAYWRGFWSLVNETNGPMRPSQVLPLAEKNYQAPLANGITVTTANHTNFTNWIGQRFNSLTNQLAAVRPPFTLTSVDSQTNSTNFVLSGYAPVEVALIRTNAAMFSTNAPSLSVTWLNETQWTATVALSMGTNVFIVEGFDQFKQKLPPYGTETYTKTNTVIRN